MRELLRKILGGGTLVTNFQNRAMLGVSFFAGIVLLVGWVAINEPARMQVFTEQHMGRSIEAGAATFLNNCSTCHGIDGKGLQGVAPALNNPMLFLKNNPAKDASDKLAALTKQQTDLRASIDDYNKNVQDLASAQVKVDLPTTSADDKKKLQDQITSLSAKTKGFDLAATQKQIDDLDKQVGQAQNDLDKLKSQGWDETRDVRLNEVKWGGTLRDYIKSTVISGRPVSSLYWPRPMPNWGQASGGPMRDDEIDDVTNYILNFETAAVKLVPNDVQQQFKVINSQVTAKLCKPLPDGSVPQPVGDTYDIAKADAAGVFKGGDANNGSALYGALGCVGCHNGATAPNVEGTYTRVSTVRVKLDQYAGKSPEYYIASSILHPTEYLVPNFAPIMPQTFASQLCAGDLKDLIGFLQTKK